MWGKKKTSIKRTDVEPGGEKQNVFKCQTSPKKKEKKKFNTESKKQAAEKNNNMWFKHSNRQTVP